MAAEIFRDTMLEVGGISEDDAETTRIAFYAFRKNVQEETMSKIVRIASKMSISSTNRLNQSMRRKTMTEKKDKEDSKEEIKDVPVAAAAAANALNDNNRASNEIKLSENSLSQEIEEEKEEDSS